MTRFTRFTKVRTKRAGRVVGAMAAASCEAGLKLDGMGCKQKSASYARSTARIEEKVFGLRRPELLCVGPSKPNNLALSFLRRRCHRPFRSCASNEPSCTLDCFAGLYYCPNFLIFYVNYSTGLALYYHQPAIIVYHSQHTHVPRSLLRQHALSSHQARSAVYRCPLPFGEKIFFRYCQDPSRQIARACRNKSRMDRAIQPSSIRALPSRSGVDPRTICAFRVSGRTGIGCGGGGNVENQAWVVSPWM